MKIPNKVRIGGVDYDVKFEPNVRIDSRILYGKIEFANSTITISTSEGESHQHKCITLLHEILHGIAYHASLELPEEIEEKIIDTFAKGMYQVLQDNGQVLFDLAVK